jgi:RimJ/RimL family protein N-acetyltransferase
MKTNPAPRRFSPRLFAIKDRRRLIMRAIRPSDAEAVEAAFYRLSDESRRQRFMTAVTELTPEMLERAVKPLQGRELVLVAVRRDGAGEIIAGGARYVADSDARRCEFAVTVSDDWQGLGIATKLMRVLMDVAGRRGIEEIYGYVLATNQPMLRLALRLGFDVLDSDEGATVKLVRAALRKPRRRSRKR